MQIFIKIVNLGYSFELSVGISYESHEAKTFLAGSHHFKIMEIEVYKILI